MDLNDIIRRLEAGQKPVTKLQEERERLIDKEVKLLSKFVEKIYPFATKKKILGNNCVLIYVYKGSPNHTTSDEVYLSPEGYVTYQVYDEATYKGFVPFAEVEDGYSKVRIDYFLKHKPLFDIIKFFDKRPSVLKQQEYELSETNDSRKAFIEEFTERLNDF